MTRSQHNIANAVCTLEPSLVRLRRVMHNLRGSDVEEATALIPDFDPEQAAAYYWNSHKAGARVMLIGSSDEDIKPCRVPFAMLALCPMFDGVANIAFLATEEFKMIAHAATLHLRTSIIPNFYADGWRRVEVRAMARQQSMCRWIEYLGARFECNLPCYGLRGETFRQYAWTQAPKTENDYVLSTKN